MVFAGINGPTVTTRPQLTVSSTDLTVVIEFSASGHGGGATAPSSGRPSHANPMPITGPATLSAKGNGYFGLRVVKTSDGPPKAVTPTR